MEHGRPIQLRGNYFFQKEQLRTRWNNSSAFQFLSQFKDDATAMTYFRKLAREERSSTKSVSDAQVLKKVAGLLASGQLVVALPHDRMKMPPHIEPIRKPAAAPAPVPAKAAEPPEDLPAFTNSDFGKQAATLKTAALRRAAFCERCDRPDKNRSVA